MLVSSLFYNKIPKVIILVWERICLWSRSPWVCLSHGLLGFSSLMVSLGFPLLTVMLRFSVLTVSLGFPLLRVSLGLPLLMTSLVSFYNFWPIALDL